MRLASFFLLSFFSLLGMRLAHAQDAPIHLVEDLVEVTDATAGLVPSAMTELDGKLYFIGWQALTGNELWTSDGTPDGTRLVADTCPGRCGIHSLVPFGDAVYFESCDGVVVCQLWRSDGTAEGTAAITKFSRRSSRVSHLTAWNGALYFVASDAAHGAELRRSDGTAEGTELVVDLVPGPADGGIRRLAAAGDRILFERANNGGEIWTSDGTASGTTFLRRLSSGQFTTSPILAAGTRAFFVERYFDLWTSDGTAAGTQQILAADRVLTLLATLDGNVYFTRLSEPYDGQELWISDGTAAGTRRIRGGFPFLSAPSNGVEFLGELYFGAGVELWKTDGTAAGTARVAWLDHRIVSLGVGALDDEFLVGTANGLWRLDGDGELDLLSDAFSARGFTAFQDGAAFQAISETAGSELAVVAGGVTTVLSDAVDPGSSHPVELTAHGDSLLFADSLFPTGVYETDGEATRRLMTFEAATGFSGGSIRNVAAGGNGFVVEDDLWVVRGDGLVRLFDDLPAGSSFGRWLLRDTAVAFGNRLMFLVWSFDGAQIELWSSDGTRDGTRRLDELMEFFYCFICDPPAPLPVFGAVPSRDRLFVIFGGRLWATDGSPEGAVELDLGDSCDLCNLGPAAAVGDRLFFSTAGSFYYPSPPAPRRLWASDGTAGGTFVVREFGSPRPDGRAASMNELVGVGETLFFTVETPDLGDELWRSDGTAAGTVPVTDLRPGGESSNPRGLTTLRGELYFAADDGDHGRELWTTDGTSEGTRLVADLRPGVASSSPAELIAIDRRLHFAADDGVIGLEPWTSDGSATGTARLGDLQPGRLPSSPRSFRAAGPSVFFTAGTEETGFELWATPRQSCPSCLLNGRFLVTVEWTEDGVTTAAHPVAFSDETALFWFFERSNTELVVKLLDGRRLNGHFWVFHGALSDLEYEIRVEDQLTGAVRTYHNPPGNLCGRADVLAFRDDSAALAEPLPAVRGTAVSGDKSTCPFPGDPRNLCLRDGRFTVKVDWTNQHDGGATGFGRPIPDTDETGYFWFFDQDNLELAVKLLDGRGLNGKFWFFYGALSDVEYQITLTDWETGAVRTYRNPPGELCGGADIEALDPS